MLVKNVSKRLSDVAWRGPHSGGRRDDLQDRGAERGRTASCREQSSSAESSETEERNDPKSRLAIPFFFSSYVFFSETFLKIHRTPASIWHYPQLQQNSVRISAMNIRFNLKFGKVCKNPEA